MAAYELLALITGRPTLTRISHTKLGVLVWLWLVALTLHLIRGDRVEETPVPLAVRALAFAPVSLRALGRLRHVR